MYQKYLIDDTPSLPARLCQHGTNGTFKNDVCIYSRRHVDLPKMTFFIQPQIMLTFYSVFYIIHRLNQILDLTNLRKGSFWSSMNQHRFQYYHRMQTVRSTIFIFFKLRTYVRTNRIPQIYEHVIFILVLVPVLFSQDTPIDINREC